MASINRTYKTFNRAASEPKSVDRLAKTLIGIWNDVRHRYLFKFSPYQVYLLYSADSYIYSIHLYCYKLYIHTLHICNIF